jgi:group I intron endonuclease
MIVYMITNKINSKRYVGQTVQPIEARHWQHINDALVKKFPYPLHCAIRKYGKENFSMKVLVRCDSIEELNNREAFLIKLFGTHISKGNGYNVRWGGSNSLLSTETKEKMAISATGRVKSAEERQKLSLANKGKKLTKQHIEKLRIAGFLRVQTPESNKKVSDSKKGKPRSEETKKKLSIANTGKKYGEETIKKLRLCRKNLVAVECVQNGIKYPSVNEAARQMGISVDRILRSINGKKIRLPFTFKRVG